VLSSSRTAISCFSTRAALCRRLTPDMNKPAKANQVFVEKEFDKRPVENTPFIKSLFRGSYDEVKTHSLKFIVTIPVVGFLLNQAKNLFK